MKVAKVEQALKAAKVEQLTIDYIYSPEIKLHFKTGSLGQDYQKLVITCFDRIGNNLFFGTPPCIGEHSSSNYAYYSDVINTEPTSSVYQWIKENYPKTHKVILNYQYYTNWERCFFQDTQLDVAFILDDSKSSSIHYKSTTQGSDSTERWVEIITIERGEVTCYSYEKEE